jgi:hypothetical protein
MDLMLLLQVLLPLLLSVRALAAAVVVVVRVWKRYVLFWRTCAAWSL